jgi:16S rRNA (guanine(966)-N(2))-methyltransferase RsmD
VTESLHRPGSVRIIAGALRGRRLAVPSGESVRPTSDRVREALFGILGPGISERGFLDLFSGSGAIGIEAWSRGARPVVLVENGRRALEAIGRNLESLGLIQEITVLSSGWPRALTELGSSSSYTGPFAHVFADPPWERAPYTSILESLATSAVLAADALVVLEIEARNEPPADRPGLRRYRVAAYGRTALAFYRAGN